MPEAKFHKVDAWTGKFLFNGKADISPRKQVEQCLVYLTFDKVIWYCLRIIEEQLAFWWDFLYL